MNSIENFKKEVEDNIIEQGKDQDVLRAAKDFMISSVRSRYSYNFTWLGRPIIQYPQDIVALQEIIYTVQPDLIIETGIAHGGSLILHASICEMIDKGEVLGIDIDIREHNKSEILNHRMNKRIKMIQGSSVSAEVIEQVKQHVMGKEKILVILDSNHTHAHVLEELKLYAPFVTKDSYLLVFDTIVEDLPDEFNDNRPWSVGDNPKTAILEFMKTNNWFEIDKPTDSKLLISAAPGGYLKKVR